MTSRATGRSRCQASLLAVLLGTLPVAGAAADAACALDPIPEVSATPERPHALRAHAVPGAFDLGAAVRYLAGPDTAIRRRYYGHAAREFSMLVPENEMKWRTVRAERGTFDFCRADALVAFARRHGQRVRGGPLVWHRALPPWLEGSRPSAEELTRLLREHIQTVMGHYRRSFPGTVVQWDVVNEVIADCAGPAACGLRDSIWLRTLGPSYIELAFRLAHEADPQAELYLNEYGIEGPGPKLAAAAALLADLRFKGVPVHGVGLQFHADFRLPELEELSRTMETLARLKLDLAVTEVDVRIGFRDKPPTPRQLEGQAKVYRRVLKACLLQPRCRTFVTWGIGDATSRHYATHGTLFDAALEPKPAYRALHELLDRPEARR